MSDFETVKLKTNVPRRMILRFVYWSDGKDWTDPKTNKVKKLPPQVNLRGSIPDADGPQGNRDIQVFMPVDCLTDLQKQGVVRATGAKDNFGGDAYEVVGGSADITLEKAERIPAKDSSTVSSRRGAHPSPNQTGRPRPTRPRPPHPHPTTVRAGPPYRNATNGA
jgi:hypothetical protein